MGLVTSVLEPTKEVIIQTDRITFTVPASIVRVGKYERQFETKALATFSRLSANAKLTYLHELGHWDYEVSPIIEPVTMAKPARLEDDHIKMFNVILKVTFPQADFMMIDPQAILRPLCGVNAEEDKIEFLSNAVREAYKSTKKLILPIQCEECDEHELGHWTTLVLDKSTGQPEVP